MPKKKGSGGVPPRWGLPPVKTGRVRFATKLRPEAILALRKLGHGWANRGIEELLQRHTDTRHITETLQDVREDVARIE